VLHPTTKKESTRWYKVRIRSRIDDDVVLLSNNIEKLKNLIYRVEAECLKVGLRLSLVKQKP